MSTMSNSATTERLGAQGGSRSVVPWLTVVPLAVVMAYADGFWVVSLRGAVGSIDRTRQPFTTWLLESTLILPIFAFAVIGALMLAARWYGPVLRKPKAVVATMLLIVAAGTLVGIAVLAASSAYDYNLQLGHVMQMGSPGATSLTTAASAASQQQGTFWLQMRSVGFGSGILLVTNLALVGWLVALRGGRLDVIKTRH